MPSNSSKYLLLCRFLQIGTGSYPEKVLTCQQAYGPILRRSPNTFRYRPLDRHTVVAYGGVEFTIRDTNQGMERTIASVQTELFRRNPRMPRGWEQVAEQLAYVTPLLGEQ